MKPVLACCFSVLWLAAGAPYPASGQTGAVRGDSPAGERTVYSVFLVGDAGAETPSQDSLPASLARQLQAAGPKASVVWLGNHAGCKGSSGPDDAGEREVPSGMPLLTALRNFPGRVVCLPGTCDWDNGGRDGWQAVRRQEQSVEQYLGRGDVFLPGGGCPGPVEVPLSEQVTLVVLDTQWWLHPWDKPGEESDCEAKEAMDVSLQLDDILARNRHKRVIVAGHHPLYSYGRPGGYRPARVHLFPLTDLHPGLYVPLPVLGSGYALYRRLLGGPQDIPHPRYQVQRNALRDVLDKYPGVVYAAGHDDALQYIRKGGVHYVNPGAAARDAYLAPRKRDLQYGRAEGGFARLDYQAGGEVWLSLWPAGPGGNEPLYREKLPAAPPEPPLAGAEPGGYSGDSLVTRPASDLYGAGRFKTGLLGSNYRSEWGQPVTLPVFDIGREKGGLTLLKMGGGMQTKSLRLQAADGRQYVLRSVDKRTQAVIPRSLRGTLADDLLQDQISASHPYGALAVPGLAAAAGVYAARPELVFVPDDPRLGKYQALFANTVAMLEVRPEETGEDHPEGGQKVYSTTKMLARLQAHPGHRVDQPAVLRARLFDILIGDWDRHDDQWRWLEKEEGPGTTYSPLPRDRDQAFFVNQGLLPRIASRKWILPKFQGFDRRIRDVARFNFNARHFDRSFLNGFSRADWLAVADTLQRRMNDAAMQQALESLPGGVQQPSGAQILEKLKARRNHLAADAERYYRFLARAVDVPGSDGDELFRVRRLDAGQTELEVYKLGKDRQPTGTLYRRVFEPDETREIRLYGLGGADVFTVEGTARESVKVRIIGGKGNDTITDRSAVRGAARNTWVYDTRQGNTLSLGGEARDRTAYRKTVNDYDRKAFQYNHLGPLASVQFNPDDGLFLGAGLLYRTHGFRKSPYATQHRLAGNYAFATSAYHFDYRGDFVDVLGGLDLGVDLRVKGPNFVNNFFGYGNETAWNEADSDIDFYRARVRSIRVSTVLIKNVFRTQKLYLGPAFESFQVQNTPGRFIAQTGENGLDGETLFRRKQYLGLEGGFVFDTRDNALLPTSGSYWQAEGALFKGLNGPAGDYARLESDLSLYWSFRLPARVTLATRFGGSLNAGGYEFFQAGTLGGLTNLRGYLRSRFTGRSTLYNNTELRLRLLSFRTYLFPAYFGVLAFHDVGRVWNPGEDSDTWHRGSGGGVWLAPFRQAVIAFMYGVSREDRVPLLRVGFQF
jgi:hypothetical protein